MDKGNGFLVFLGIIVIVVAFFTIEPVDNIDTKNNGVRNDSGSFIDRDRNEEISPREIENEIEIAQRELEEIQEGLDDLVSKQNQSPYYGQIEIRTIRDSENYNKEYIRLSSDYRLDSPINITGWTLKSEFTGRSVEIKKGAKIFRTLNTFNTDIVVEEGMSIYVVTGPSPVGDSFRTNLCTGYLEQNRDFYPSLRKQCPHAIDDSPISLSPQTEQCVEYIKDIPRCYSPSGDVPYFGGQCNAYLLQEVNYAGCLRKHEGDIDFYGNEWRIYLNKTIPIWEDRNENIVLYDEKGLVVDVYKN